MMMYFKEALEKNNVGKTECTEFMEFLKSYEQSVCVNKHNSSKSLGTL